MSRFERPLRLRELGSVDSDRFLDRVILTMLSTGQRNCVSLSFSVIVSLNRLTKFLATHRRLDLDQTLLLTVVIRRIPVAPGCPCANGAVATRISVGYNGLFEEVPRYHTRLSKVKSVMERYWLHVNVSSHLRRLAVRSNKLLAPFIHLVLIRILAFRKKLPILLLSRA